MGKSILFIHGFGFGGDVWGRVTPAFENAGWRCETPTLYQHLRTRQSPPSALNALALTDYVKAASDYARQLKAEEGEAPVIIGHSMGGLIAQKLTEYGQASASVFLTPAPPTDCHSTSAGAIFAFANIALIPASRRRRSAVRMWRPGYYHMMANTLAPSRRLDTYPRLRHESGCVFNELASPDSAIDDAASVDQRQIFVPTLTIGAGRDRITSITASRKVGRKYAESPHPGDYREYPRSGHMILDEPSADQMSKDILTWIESHQHYRSLVANG